MRIEHVAIWTNDLERLKSFYEHYFGAVAAAKYRNPGKAFESYFLNFDSGARLELMQKAGIDTSVSSEKTGLAHLALSVGSKEKVESLTEELRAAGFQVTGEPRVTGDGYYESVILDPDGNRIEITI